MNSLPSHVGGIKNHTTAISVGACFLAWSIAWHGLSSLARARADVADLPWVARSAAEGANQDLGSDFGGIRGRKGEAYSGEDTQPLISSLPEHSNARHEAGQLFLLVCESDL